MRCEIDRIEIGKSLEHAVGLLAAAAQCAVMDKTILAKAANAARSCVYIWSSDRPLSVDDLNTASDMLRTAIAAAQQLMRLELEVASGARNISPEIAAFMPLRLEKPSGLSIAEAALSEDLIKYNSNGTMAALSELTTRWSIYARAMTASAARIKTRTQKSELIIFPEHLELNM